MSDKVQLVVTLMANRDVRPQDAQAMADIVFQVLADTQVSAGAQGLSPDVAFEQGLVVLLGTVQVWPPLKAEQALSENEIERFHSEMAHNLEGDKTTIEVLLNLISDTPAAAAAFRLYLQEQEQTTWEALNEH